MEELKIQQRSVIRFLTLENQAPKDIHLRLQNVFGQEALSYTQVKFWAAETNRGRKSVQDEIRSGRPSDATSTENIEAVEKLVMENRRTKVWEIAAETGLSRGTIFRVLVIFSVSFFSLVVLVFNSQLISKEGHFNIFENKYIIYAIFFDKKLIRYN
jgi:hypothetical protein